MASEIQGPTPFDYSALPGDLANEARTIAARVRERAQQQIASIIETGRDLAGIKEKLGHGQFGEWLLAEFDMNERTAQRYMSAATAFHGKTDIVSYLPPSTIYALAAPSTPEPVRQQVIEQLEAGEKVDPVDVRFAIREAKARDRELAKIEKMKPTQKRQHRRRERDLAREEEDWKAKRDAEKSAALDAAIMIEKALGDDLATFVDKLKEADLFEFRRYFAE